MGIGDYNIYTKQSSLRTGYKSDTDWTLAGSGTHETAWRGANLPLEQPLEVQPGDTAAIYIHTTGQHDRGIAYQSYSRLDQRIAGDENLTLYPGQARIGSNPFAVVEGQEVEAAGLWGWYRAPRGLAGAVRYRCRRPWRLSCRLRRCGRHRRGADCRSRPSSTSLSSSTGATGLAPPPRGNSAAPPLTPACEMNRQSGS